jgi:hypothetical protein
MKKNIKKNRGFVILFAVTLSAIILAIALGIANIALKEIKFGTSAKDTNNAFFAADTGIECALLNDKSATSVFVTGTSPSFMCNNRNITANETPASSSYWSFNVFGLGSDGQGCARVTVDKTIPPKTTVIAKGYNIGDVSCSSSNSNHVERELKTTYESSL